MGMRGSAWIIALAIIMAGACAWTGSEADAEAPAEVYFFSGDVCTAQVYLKAGEPIGNAIPELPGWATCWADDTGHRITPQSTFEAGAHTIIACASEPTPQEPAKSTGPAGAIAGIAGAFLIIAAIGALAYIHYRRD